MFAVAEDRNETVEMPDDANDLAALLECVYDSRYVYKITNIPNCNRLNEPPVL
jgi:hypothetical protein